MKLLLKITIIRQYIYKKNIFISYQHFKFILNIYFVSTVVIAN